MSVGNRIKSRRSELGLSQRSLGKKCSISGSAIAQWETEQTHPAGENLMQVAKALQTTPEWIMTGETKAAQGASDRKFSKFIDDNLKYLSDEQRKDIETLVEHAIVRESILNKYK